MIDLVLLSIAAVLILASPFPIVGMIGGILVYCSVGFIMWAATRSAAVNWRRGKCK